MGDARTTVGARIRELRLEQDLTQEHVAERASISYKFLGEVERGTANPSIATLERIASALGVEIADLFAARAGGYARPAKEVPMVRELVRTLQHALVRLEGKSARKRASRGPARKQR